MFYGFWVKNVKICKQEPVINRRCFIIRKEYPLVEFDSGACALPGNLDLWKL